MRWQPGFFPWSRAAWNPEKPDEVIIQIAEGVPRIDTEQQLHQVRRDWRDEHYEWREVYRGPWLDGGHALITKPEPL